MSPPAIATHIDAEPWHTQDIPREKGQRAEPAITLPSGDFYVLPVKAVWEGFRWSDHCGRELDVGTYYWRSEGEQ